MPKGGPNGGDGGKGGDVWFVATYDRNTLVDFRHVHTLNAEDGQPGGPNRRSGKSGKDRIIHVPVGTLLMDSVEDRVLADLDEPQARFLAASGGKGGRGNARFVSSTRRVPRYAQPGLPGEQILLKLELKLLADVGIIGLPSVGKSTLISRISASKARAGDFPFTTLVPNLGVVEAIPDFPYVVADMPGLIQGASEGKGLGIRFLKHIQRTSTLLHVLDISREDPIADWREVRQELEAFDKTLLHRPELVVLNKIDALSPEEVQRRGDQLRDIFRPLKRRVLLISAATGEGVSMLVKTLAHSVKKASDAVKTSSAPHCPVLPCSK